MRAGHGRKIHCGSFRRGERREAGWVGRCYFRFAPLANRHAGSQFTYSTRAGKTGLTKVKNFSDESLRVSRWNELLADGMSFLTECLHAGDIAYGSCCSARRTSRIADPPKNTSVIVKCWSRTHPPGVCPMVGTLSGSAPDRDQHPTGTFPTLLRARP